MTKVDCISNIRIRDRVNFRDTCPQVLFSVLTYFPFLFPDAIVSLRRRGHRTRKKTMGSGNENDPFSSSELMVIVSSLFAQNLL